MQASSEDPGSLYFLSGGGEMGELIRSLNWSATELGSPEHWPPALKQTVSMMLTARFPILICWGKNYIQLYNDAFRPINGVTKHPQAMGGNARNTYAEIWDTIGSMFEGVMKGETFGFPDFMVPLDRNGRLEDCYFDFSYSPIYEENGNVSGVLVICMETTDKVNSIKKLNSVNEELATTNDALTEAQKILQYNEKFLKQAEEKSAKLAAIIESSDDAIISKTLESVITSWNDSAERIFGYKADEIIGETIYKLIPPERTEEEPRILSRLKSGERVEHFETQRLTKDGRLIDVSVTVSPVKDPKGNIIGLSKIARDITERKLDEDRKNDFIGMASHELKTPLTSLMAIIQVLNAKLKNSEDAFVAGALDKANVQVKKMNNMINGFLNISRLESGKIMIDKQEFNLEDLVEEMIKETELTISSHVIKFKPGNPVMINADHDKIGSVITNLISNAVKYSPNGKVIEIKCELRDHTARVSVKDEGIGIKPQDVDKLFDRYYRVENYTTRHIAGFGIGLYLSAEIIQRHDGKIWVESQEGNGSTFHFSLPA